MVTGGGAIDGMGGSPGIGWLNLIGHVFNQDICIDITLQAFFPGFRRGRTDTWVFQKPKG